MNTPLRRTLKTLAAGTLTAGLVVLGATAASAHVSVVPEKTEANGDARLTFNVPNESKTAKTSKLEVKLPTDTPFTSVSVKPVEGWTAKVITSDLPQPVTVEGTTVTQAPTSVVWTADADHQIGQNQYQSFSLSVGKLPAEGTDMVLPAAQTYTDGTVVNWDEQAAEGQAEPEHPAPSFTTTAAAADAHGAIAEASPAAAPASQAAGSDAAVWGIVLGALGTVLGAVALAVALAGRRRTAK
jgi:uncharacterized protein YcnI